MTSLRQLLVFVTTLCVALAPTCFAQSTTAKAISSDRNNGPVVDAPAGKVEGLLEGNVRVFKGIPYVLPPTGSARWRPPNPMPRWSNVRNATAFGPICYQLASVYALVPTPMSEDCLTLNIWAPVDAHKAPIFFWIHGGALTTGSSQYDGKRLADRGVIVVSINYRLGVFGWLAHPELSKESSLGISGNYGLLDQISALKWVRQNISAFGGDPTDVTIAGESAGALSVMYLMTSPPARGLFAKAILESAYMISTPELTKRNFGALSAEESGVRLAAAIHAPNIAALRAMDAGTLNSAAVVAGFEPYGAIDGQVLPRQLVDAFDRGEQAAVPLLAGFNSGEIRAMKFLVPAAPATPAEYESTIRDRYLDLADEFLRLYPSAQMQESILATTRDALYGWTSERLVRKQAKLGLPSFLYYFDHGYPAADIAGLRGFHASELPYVFGTIDRTMPLWPKIPPTPEERKFSDAMIGYWTAFVRTGRPQAVHEPDWPAFDPAGSYMAFEQTPKPSNHLFPGMFELNEEVICRRRANGNIAWNWNVGLASPKLPSQQVRCKQ